MFSNIDTSRKVVNLNGPIKQQSQSNYDRTTEIGSEDSRLGINRFAGNYLSERNLHGSKPQLVPQFQAIPEERVLNKDLMILEGQLKNQMQRITEERSARQVSIQQPEILLQTVQVLMKHPLFTNMNMNTVMLMIKHSFAFINLKKLQILYKEGDDAPLTFIPIFG